ncbi:isopentenyl-diphosphate Delta-isomerase [Tatumella saanichensis]|uniref:isopentenyl-diphosphate Delta-isomerase n=1 Tax=Tatumella saanichensis TaxID=480813 RepID=UPI0004A4D76E|nr:isopentenyl-diphosphate Delta-isomerase [Tatumella saanichensis]
MSLIEVILVDPQDNPTGTMEKQEVHRKGLMHRAVTVYLFNHRGELLLQRRARDKYHCGGLWSNTCCGHPLPGEQTHKAAERRLAEEMGISTILTAAFELSYHLTVTDGLSEHEYGHIFFGHCDQPPILNPAEADAWRYSSLSQLQAEMAAAPQRFTPWFVHTLSRVVEYRQHQAAGAV